MARQLRIEFNGAFYHITSRGNLRGRIFFEDEDRKRFLELLKRAKQRYGQTFRGHHIYLLSFLFGPGFSGLRERFSSFSSPLTKLLLPSGLPVFSWRRIFLTFCSSVTVERNSFQSAMSKEEFLKRYCGGVEPETKTNNKQPEYLWRWI